LPMPSFIFPLIIIGLLAVIGSVLLTSLKKVELKWWLGILILLCALGIFLAQVSHYWDFFVDDAYISMRYAKNLAETGSLRFNLNDETPVEGYSNFLWILTISPIFLFNINHVLFIKILGLSLSILNLGMVYWILSRAFGDRTCGLTGVWMMALFPPLALWAVGGLETPFYIFTILLSVGYFLKRKRHWLSGLLFLLPALTRHEGVVLFFIGLFLLIFQGLSDLRGLRSDERVKRRTEFFRNIVSFALPFIILYGMYYLWRWQYYDMFIPNTFYAKVRFSWDYFVVKVINKASVLHYISPLMLLALANFLGGERDRKFRSMAFFTIITALLSILPYRDWMPGFRYVLPAIPLLIIMASNSLVRIGRNKNLKFFPALVLMVIVSFYLLTGNILIRGATVDMCEVQKEMGLYLKGIAPEESSLATFDLGAISYYSEIPVIYDTHIEGILSPETTKGGLSLDNIVSKGPTFYYLLVPLDVKDESEYWGLNELLVDEDFKRDYVLLKVFPYGKSEEFRIYGLREKLL